MKTEIFASVRNPHRTLQLHSLLLKCRFTISREHNNSFHFNIITKHRHLCYTSTIQMFELRFLEGVCDLQMLRA